MPPVKRHALQNLSSNIPLVSHKNSSSNLVIDQIRRLPLGNRESNITFLHTQQVSLRIFSLDLKFFSKNSSSSLKQDLPNTVHQ